MGKAKGRDITKISGWPLVLVDLDGTEIELPAAPADLSPEAVNWWYRILAPSEIEEGGLLELQTAMEFWDVMQAAKREKKYQLMEKASVRVRAHMRALGLDINPTRATPGRPPKE